ncbi:MAG: tRNA threonylcarbamoyladenosine dehydratase [Gracilibacteraceae bacterium]|jgi:tRNA A37 threonylcarbamoyladenosine dehydratase|nr:tRNA threonylcarbamoyladenosine dehydratase [Gracilibacteraceae bacterium]
MNSFSRTELLIGKKGIERLKKSTVAVFGIGGVGSYAAEALCRCGIGRLVLIDYDDICITNINRQIHATRKTVGRPKVEVMKERLLDINPEAEIITHKMLYDDGTSEMLLLPEYDYVVDAIDMVSSKISLVLKCAEMNIRIISCMGAGNKLDPTKFVITDIYKTSVCPLAKVMRYELRKRGVKSLKVVYSKEEPIVPDKDASDCEINCVCSSRRQVPGSISFVPSAAGLIIASAVVRDILGL